jgi:hypothetical protein
MIDGQFQLLISATDHDKHHQGLTLTSIKCSKHTYKCTPCESHPENINIKYHPNKRNIASVFKNRVASAA